MHNITTPQVSIDAQLLLSVSGGCGRPCCPPTPPLPQAQGSSPTDGPDSIVNAITITNANGTTTRTV